MKKISLILVLAALSGSILPFSLLAQGTAFTYQGQLDSSGAPVFGLYDFRFRLASDPSANSYVASPWVTNGVPVTNGLFTVALDFGSGIFNGNSYWLEVDVRTNGGGTYANLAPLQALTPAPYAVMANSASNLLGALPASQLSGAVPSANLGGTYSAAVTLNNAGNSFTGNGSGLSSLNASQLTTGTLPDARLSGNVARLNANQTFTGQNLFQNGIGIGNPAPVWGLDVLAAQAVGRFVTTNSVNGSGIELRNTITNLTGYTLGAINFNNYSNTYPGQIAYIAGDWFTPNRDHMDFRVAGSLGLSLRADPTGSGAPNIVAGSYVNFISTVGCSGNTIAGGGNVPQGNFIDANCSANFIGSGIYNLFGTNVSRSFVGAGYLNQIFANAYDDVIGGGNQNVIQGSVSDSVIAGGSSITIQGGASGCSVGGGFANTIQGGTYNSTIAGGGGNVVNSNAQFATIAGGQDNHVAGIGSFAAGQHASALHDGSFVWADSVPAYFSDTGSNQFLLRAGGGVGINTNNPGNSALSVNGVASVSGALNVNGPTTVSGVAQLSGLLRSGSENANSDLPSPAGLVVRRINSYSQASGQIIARTDSLTLLRDGTHSGLLVGYPNFPGKLTVNFIGVNNAGTTVGGHLALNSPAGPGTQQLFTDAQHLVHVQISFGRTYDSGTHMTQVVLDRYDDGTTSDYYWVGTLTSTFNQ